MQRNQKIVCFCVIVKIRKIRWLSLNMSIRAQQIFLFSPLVLTESQLELCSRWDQKAFLGSDLPLWNMSGSGNRLYLENRADSVTWIGNWNRPPGLAWYGLDHSGALRSGLVSVCFDLAWPSFIRFDVVLPGMIWSLSNSCHHCASRKRWRGKLSVRSNSSRYKNNKNTQNTTDQIKKPH